jgi:ribosome-associated protein
LFNGSDGATTVVAMSTPLVINDKVTLPGHDIEWTAVRASGPGGQNVNKVSSKIELTFDLEDSVALTDQVKARLRVIAKNSLDGEGRILITSQKTRDQSKNLSDAREKLKELVAKALVIPKTRKPTKPTKGSKVRRLTAKKKVGAKKAARKPPRRGDD